MDKKYVALAVLLVVIPLLYSLTSSTEVARLPTPAPCEMSESEVIKKWSGYSLINCEVYYTQILPSENWKKLEPQPDQSTFASYPGYASDNQSIYFQAAKIEGADTTTFKSWARDFGDHFGALWGSDANAVYFFGKKISYLDPNSFETITDSFVKDKAGVYSLDFPSSQSVYFGPGVITKIPEADPQSFKVKFYETPMEGDLPGPFQSDKDSIFFSGSLYGDVCVVPNAEPETFKYLGAGFYGYDRQALYWGCRQVGDANPDTVSVVSLDFVKDDKNVYFDGEKIEGADVETFTTGRRSSSEYTYSQYWAHDKNCEYVVNIGGTTRNLYGYYHSPLETLCGDQ